MRAVPREQADREAYQAQLRQAVRARVACLYPGVSPGLRAVLTDQLCQGLLEPGPLVVLTGL